MEHNHSQMTKPLDVSNATKLLFISFSIGILTSMFTFTSQIESLGFLIVAFIICVWYVFLIFKIMQGKNWARITFLVLFILGIPGYISLLPSFLQTHFYSALFLVVQLTLNASALILLFKKTSSEWFISQKIMLRRRDTLNPGTGGLIGSPPWCDSHSYRL